MSLKQYQRQVHAWVSQFRKPYFSIDGIKNQINEEVDEVFDVLDTVYGKEGTGSYTEQQKIDLGNEIADVMFALSCLANREGVDLEESWQLMMKRRYERDNDRFEKKE